jgi:hypothetical protein
MAEALEQAWKTVQDSGPTLATMGHAEATRELLALRIIEIAQLGERDPSRLRNDALAYLARTNLKSSGLERLWENFCEMGGARPWKLSGLVLVAVGGLDRGGLDLLRPPAFAGPIREIEPSLRHPKQPAFVSGRSGARG